MQPSGARGRRTYGERGIALLVVLVILAVVAASSSSFIWFMNQQQARAGMRYRSAAAMAAAEAGVNRALSILETIAPDGGGPGRTWRPATYSETMPVGPFEGRFTLSLADDADGAVMVTSAGEVGGITRRLRARAYLASPALLAAIHGVSIVHLEKPPAAVVILPYGAGIGDRPWIHIAAGRGIEFATADVSINDPRMTFEASPGPVDAPESANSSTAVRAPGPVRLLLARGADLTLGQDRQRVDVQQLRVLGVRVEGVVFHTKALPDLPQVDRAYYRDRAAHNTNNANLNNAAGKYVGNAELTRKAASLYTWMEFEQLGTYLKDQGLSGPLRGVIYVEGGGVSVLDGQRLQIVDGALVAEGTVDVGLGASLEITHSAATRTLPGIVVLDRGTLIVLHEGRLRVHGLVYANRTVDVGTEAHVDIVGAVLGNDPELSFRSFGASVVVRYDPAVLGTPGLRTGVDAPVVAWIAAWEELP